MFQNLGKNEGLGGWGYNLFHLFKSYQPRPMIEFKFRIVSSFFVTCSRCNALAFVFLKISLQRDFCYFQCFVCFRFDMIVCLQCLLGGSGQREIRMYRQKRQFFTYCHHILTFWLSNFLSYAYLCWVRPTMAQVI